MRKTETANPGSLKRVVRALASIVDEFPDTLKALMLVSTTTCFFFGPGWVTKLIKWIWAQVP
jgi:hypothetical protein